MKVKHTKQACQFLGHPVNRGKIFQSN